MCNYRKAAQTKKNCISNFSVYSNIACSQNIHDPYDEERALAEASAENGGEWKQKLSKSTKKRLRRLRKKKLSAQNAKPAQTIKKVAPQVIKKQTKKDLKMIMKRLSKL